MMRNPHAGEPFIDDDAAIAAALEDVSVPALLCSLVHMTGDPSWVRGDIRPRLAVSLDIQSGMPAYHKRARKFPTGVLKARGVALQPDATSHRGVLARATRRTELISVEHPLRCQNFWQACRATRCFP